MIIPFRVTIKYLMRILNTSRKNNNNEELIITTRWHHFLFHHHYPSRIITGISGLSDKQHKVLIWDKLEIFRKPPVVWRPLKPRSFFNHESWFMTRNFEWKFDGSSGPKWSEIFKILLIRSWFFSLFVVGFPIYSCWFFIWDTICRESGCIISKSVHSE